jgi:hypothetical protein
MDFGLRLIMEGYAIVFQMVERKSSEQGEPAMSPRSGAQRSPAGDLAKQASNFRLQRPRREL